MEEKLSWLLQQKFNLFHADLISRALHDDSIDIFSFMEGFKEVERSERDTDNDEFVPEVFAEV